MKAMKWILGGVAAALIMVPLSSANAWGGGYHGGHGDYYGRGYYGRSYYGHGGYYGRGYYGHGGYYGRPWVGYRGPY
jgi:hypothetical protein